MLALGNLEKAGKNPIKDAMVPAGAALDSPVLDKDVVLLFYMIYIYMIYEFIWWKYF